MQIEVAGVFLMGLQPMGPESINFSDLKGANRYVSYGASVFGSYFLILLVYITQWMSLSIAFENQSVISKAYSSADRSSVPLPEVAT